MSSIGDLPAELLIDIFENCSWSAPLAPLTLSFVCNMWHDIVYTSPRVWQHISLQDVRNQRVVAVEKLERQASVWLANSSPMPFDVTVDFQFHSQELFLAIISILMGGLHRWKSCTFVRGKRKVTVDVSGIVLAPGAYSDYSDSDPGSEDSENEERAERSALRGGKVVVDRLEVMVDEAVGLGQHFGDEDGSDMDDSDYDELEGKLPTFRRLRTGSIALNYPVPNLPVPSQINPMGITVLTITEMGFNPPDPIRLLHFLTAFPEIVTLTFDGHALEPECDEDDIPPVVALPKLCNLTIGNTCSIRIILSHLAVPALTSLYLQHLNTDAVIPNQLTGEEGDSEDEAHDYSQSPSSDHATGMGLRMLQKRSNPPLRVLDMDYSDLRTKDFLYCFDHFSLLREFRIVASDMSDKVIEMLAPHVGASGKREIRLPYLKELELYHCQRVTGSAMVNALRERVAFAHRSPIHPQMDLVRVVGCAEVLPEHELALSAILGSGFHS
ncbi:hypothetical protein BJ322DRAFT_1214224 [Thelephora terrestris]|uniref:F-box domain-containing protein n=1 Tax=Thelephora terrestris TaxID=56493 RepID=A0A9P6H508_9AGAM|nr:hypothetical protein BJ322DRAFT_1214224 [Thelephora terrestris]